MLDLKRLLSLLSYLHDGSAKVSWASPIAKDGEVHTNRFWSKFKDKYKLC